jgi:xanthine dehydrogenase iron-sulfur cluster and FAD-binding subunit A
MWVLTTERTNTTLSRAENVSFSFGECPRKRIPQTVRLFTASIGDSCFKPTNAAAVMEVTKVNLAPRVYAGCTDVGLTLAAAGAE